MSPATLTHLQFRYFMGYTQSSDRDISITLDTDGNATCTLTGDGDHKHIIALDPNGVEIDLAKQHRDTVLQALSDAWAANPTLKLGELIAKARDHRFPMALVEVIHDDHLVRGFKAMAS